MLETLWGPSAIAAVENIKQSSPRWADVDKIYVQTIEEQKKKFCSEFTSKQSLDDLFGVGRWTAMMRFLILQASGKERIIDDALRAGINAATNAWETIFTIDADFPHCWFSSSCVRSFAYSTPGSTWIRA